MYNSSYNWWTLSPDSDTSGLVLFMLSFGYVGSNEVDSTMNGYSSVRPVITLSSEVQIIGGTGTQDDPYTIE